MGEEVKEVGNSKDGNPGLRLLLCPVMTSEQFSEFLRDAGLQAGDVVLVHSSLRAIGPVDGGADGIIDTFLNVLGAGGAEGLLAVPTHTWATVNDQQPVFHQRYSPSTVGVLTNVLRERANAIRSLHPSHSVAAIGKRASEFCAKHELDNTPCPPMGPYGKLIDWRGKVVLLGVGLTRCTYFHCLEELAELNDTLAPVAKKRYLIRNDGSVHESFYHSHVNGRSENFGRSEPELLAAGVMSIHTRGPATVRIVDAVKARDYLVDRLRTNPKLWL
ncbi:MAG: AAC(3) family N-acetyltransferase [Phycisphaerales bacterium]|nr:AAC(3) family N-acetyltransferase [Phycisphaerales bacterium]